MTQTVTAFAEKNHRAAPFHAKYFRRHVRALLGELFVRNLEEIKETFSSFVLFLDRKTYRTKKLPLDYDSVHHY